MRRLLLVVGMGMFCVITVLTFGIVWLRLAPTFPADMRTISPGMTIAQVEARLGQRLVGARTCMAVDYVVEVPDHWWYGKVAFLYLSAPPRPQDEPETTISDGGDLVVRKVDFYRCTKLDRLSQQPWASVLIGPEEP